MVKGLYMTGSNDEDVYCGVIKINNFRKAFFLGQINDLEVAVMEESFSESVNFYHPTIDILITGSCHIQPFNQLGLPTEIKIYVKQM